jgi:hypothetical protein
MKNLAIHAILAWLPLSLFTAALHGDPVPPRPDETIFVVTGSFGSGGALVSMQRQSPWDAVTVAELDSSSAAVQTFSGEIYVVEPETDLVRVFDGAGTEIRSFSVGAGTSPRDILGVARNRAYVTRSHSTHLYRLDPQTGVGSDVVDLSVFADADGVPDMERMATDGSRLFIQLRRLQEVPRLTGGDTNGAIAVVDLETESLIDADPETPGVNAIELVGPAPRLRMHIDTGGGYLLVSATDGDHLSLNGGVEYIDLPTLASQGFVLAEIELAALGGFVITNPTGGYFLFHTDIVPSNHLNRFTITGGPVPGPEIVFDFGVYLDALLYDTETDLLYMPAAAGGMHVVDTNTNTPLTPQPIPLPGFPVDQVIGPIGSPYDLTGDGVVGILDFLVLLAAWGDCVSPCPPSCIADIAAPDGPGSDCTVDILDALLLLANWG